MSAITYNCRVMQGCIIHEDTSNDTALHKLNLPLGRRLISTSGACLHNHSNIPSHSTPPLPLPPPPLTHNTHQEAQCSPTAPPPPPHTTLTKKKHSTPPLPLPPHTTLTKKKHRAPSSNDTKKPVIRCFADYVYKVETTWVNSEKVRNLNFYERSILISREIYFRWQCYTIVLWLCMHV